MTTTTLIGQEIIDLEDAENRIVDLTVLKNAVEGPPSKDEDLQYWTATQEIWYLDSDFDEEAATELEALLNLKFELSWAWDKGGRALIHEDRFESYAEEEAYDIGSIQRDSCVASHVNWDCYADSVKQDYKEVEFVTDTYFIRA